MSRSPDHPLLISFSGLDGSGKTTQIEQMRSVLAQSGVNARVLAFWDDVVVLSRYRERFVRTVLGSEQGIGAPGKPVDRRDKNIRGWHLTLARHFMYLADALHLRFVIRRSRTSGAIIMDRYIYDELANLPLTNHLSRLYIRCVLAVVPRPDIAYLLDADPAAARARKPEYPIEFMGHCRRAYLKLASIAGMTVIPPLPLAEAQEAVASTLHRSVGTATPRDTVQAA